MGADERRLRRLRRLETCATRKSKRPAGVGTPALQNGNGTAGVGTPALQNGNGTAGPSGFLRVNSGTPALQNGKGTAGITRGGRRPSLRIRTRPCLGLRLCRPSSRLPLRATSARGRGPGCVNLGCR